MDLAATKHVALPVAGFRRAESLVLFDDVGGGQSDFRAYDESKYSLSKAMPMTSSKLKHF
jgi:hypothetical protein